MNLIIAGLILDQLNRGAGAASIATITPAAYQTNLMVYEDGGYTTLDFVKLGVPLTVIVGIVTIILAPIAFPF